MPLWSPDFPRQRRFQPVAAAAQPPDRKWFCFIRGQWSSISLKSNKNIVKYNGIETRYKPSV
jgi:hypothetical protein